MKRSDQVLHPLLIDNWVELINVVLSLCNGLKMNEYEVYWLMDFPLNNN